MRKPFALTLAALACAVSLFTLANAQQPDPKTQAIAISSLSNAKQLALATMMYVQDNDERFPYGKTTAEIKPKLLPYLKNPAIFVDPTSGKDFVYNAGLSKLPQILLKEPTKSVMFYSPSAHTDGMFSVAYTDGHCKREMKVSSLTVAKVTPTTSRQKYFMELYTGKKAPGNPTLKKKK